MKPRTQGIQEVYITGHAQQPALTATVRGLCSRNGCGPTQKSTFLTTSRPLVTEPNTTCLPSSHAVCKIVSRLMRLCTHQAHAFGEP